MNDSITDNRIKKEWVYVYPLTERFDWLATSLVFVLITNGIIALAIIFADVSRAAENLRNFSFVFWMIAGIYLLSCILTVLMFKGKYRYSYRLTDTELIRSTGMADIGVNHEMTVNRRLGNCVTLENVSRLVLNRRRNEIRIIGKLTVTTIYAYDVDIDSVWNLLVKSCPNASAKIRD